MEGLEISVLLYKEAISTDPTGRLDSNFFENRFIQFRQQAAAWTRLDIYAKSVVCGPFGSNLLNDNYVEHGIPMIRPFNLRNCRADNGEIALLNDSFIKEQELKEFAKGTVVFARVGDITAGVSLYERATISPNIIAVELRETMNPFFLGVFTNTKYGRIQLEANLKVVAQPTISTDSIRALRLPSLSQNFQQRIADTYRQVVSVEDQSKQLLSEAETSLLHTLGLDTWIPPEALSYERSSREAFAAGRLDAEHFQEQYYALATRLQEYPGGVATFGELCPNPINGVEIREYVDEGVPYLRVGDIKNFTVNPSGVEHVTFEAAAKEIDKVRLQTGDVLVSRSGSLAVTGVIEPKWTHSVISSHLILVRLQDAAFLPHYVAAFLSAIPGRMQIIQHSNGGVQPEISQPSLKRLIIPRLAESIQVKITDHILQANRFRQEAQILLDAAKRAVEIAIEDSEAAALAWLQDNGSTQTD